MSYFTDINGHFADYQLRLKKVQDAREKLKPLFGVNNDRALDYKIRERLVEIDNSELRQATDQLSTDSNSETGKYLGFDNIPFNDVRDALLIALANNVDNEEDLDDYLKLPSDWMLAVLTDEELLKIASEVGSLDKEQEG